MQIESKGSVVTIHGDIRTIEHSEAIKAELETIVRDHDDLTLNIVDSSTIISSVIGYLVKLNFMHKVHLSVNVGNQRLFNMIQELELQRVLNVQKVDL